MGTAATLDPVFPWEVHTANPCMYDTFYLILRLPTCLCDGGAKQSNHSPTGGRQFILLTRQELDLACSQFVLPVFLVHLGFLLVLDSSSFKLLPTEQGHQAAFKMHRKALVKTVSKRSNCKKCALCLEPLLANIPLLRKNVIGINF